MGIREERAADYRERLRHDIKQTLRQHGYGAPLGDNDVMYEALIEALVEDAMFHIEHLLVEVTT